MERQTNSNPNPVKLLCFTFSPRQRGDSYLSTVTLHCPLYKARPWRSCQWLAPTLNKFCGCQGSSYGKQPLIKPWARKDSFPPLAKYRSRRRTETKQINTSTLLVKLFTKNPSGYRPFQSSLYTRLIKSWCQQNTDHYGQHTNLTDNHGFREIANWKWVTTDGVDLLFLCSVLQPSDPTHASECREEARTRMADRGDVGISDRRTQHTDCVYWLLVYSQYGVLSKCIV